LRSRRALAGAGRRLEARGAGASIAARRPAARARVLYFSCYLQDRRVADGRFALRLPSPPSAALRRTQPGNRPINRKHDKHPNASRASRARCEVEP